MRFEPDCRDRCRKRQMFGCLSMASASPESHNRNTSHYNGHGIMDKRNDGPPTSAEETAETEMNTRKHTIPYIPLQILTTLNNDLRVVGKQADRLLGEHLHDDGEERTEADNDAIGIPKGTDGTIQFASPQILGRNSRNRRQHGRRDEEQNTDYFFNNPYCRCIIQSSLVGYDSNDNESHLNKSVLQGYRHSDIQYLPHDSPLWFQVGPTDTDTRIPPVHGYQSNNNTYRLRKRGSPSRSGSPHIKITYQQIIE